MNVLVEKEKARVVRKERTKEREKARTLGEREKEEKERDGAKEQE